MIEVLCELQLHRFLLVLDELVRYGLNYVFQVFAERSYLSFVRQIWLLYYGGEDSRENLPVHGYLIPVDVMKKFTFDRIYGMPLVFAEAVLK